MVPTDRERGLINGGKESYLRGVVHNSRDVPSRILPCKIEVRLLICKPDFQRAGQKRPGALEAPAGANVPQI